MSGDYLDREAVAALLERHRRGRWDLQEPIWTLCNFEIWLRIFLGGRAPETILGSEEEIRACASSG
jgi:hypothetical protein